jgi:UDP-N-acetylmuramate dehydrogenase
MTPEGSIETLDMAALKFSYRASIYSAQNTGSRPRVNKNIILSAIIDLKKGDAEEIRTKMHLYMSQRRAKQPLEFPSAGSVFKRPEKNFAGTLIEKCGLKGKRIGDAMVSTKHAGFIVNVGNASCTDVVNLINFVKKEVFEQTGVALEKEIVVLGDMCGF